MKSGHTVQRIVQDDVVAGVTPDADRATGQTDLVLDGVATKHYQSRHIYLLRTPVGAGGFCAAGRRTRANAPETAESIRSVTRCTQVDGAFKVTVSSLLNAPDRQRVDGVVSGRA